MIKEERLQKHIHELGQFGKDPLGGTTRFPFTKEEEQAKEYVIRIMKEANLDVRVDAVGNIIGRRNGKTNTTILCGSHIDTVRNGGNYDGCLGVLSAIEVLHTMEEQHMELAYSIEVIAFKNEEGNRFTSIMTGSRAICDRLSEDDLQAKDANGITMLDAAHAFKYPIETYQTCAYNFQEVRAYLELHIEQGSVLEKHRLSVGNVKGIAGLQRYHITIYGVSGHSGAIPMQDRIDPVQAFSHISSFVFQAITKYEDAVATIGEIDVYPGSCNVICDHLTFSLDVRSLLMQDIIAFIEEVTSELQTLYTHGFTYEMDKIQSLLPALCDDKIQCYIEDALQKENLPSFSLMSGAGHDAMNFYGRCPMGMIFVKSEHGYSHRKEEYTKIEDCTKATNVLYHTLVRLSNEN